jgi:hypothetical protein
MQKHINFYAQWTAFFILVWLCGCASRPSTKSMDYAAFDRAYAEQSNEQLLLNLARLANDDPVNFLQLGSFSSQYQYTAGLGVSPNYVMNHPSYYPSGTTTTTGSTPPSGADTITHSISEFAQNALTFGANATISAQTMPIFQYLPLTGSNLVSALTTPMNPNFFYEYYDQGWPADLLARVMVASVAIQTGVITVFSTNSTTNYLVEPSVGISTNFSYAVVTNEEGNLVIQTNLAYNAVTNLPGTNVTTNVTIKIAISTTTNYEYYINSPDDPTYPKFLQFCEDLKRAQENHFLTVGPNPGGERIIYSNTKETNLTGIVAAVQANLTVKWDTNNDHVTISQAPQQADAIIANTNDYSNGKYATSTSYELLVITNIAYVTNSTFVPVAITNTTYEPVAITNLTYVTNVTYAPTLATNIMTNITYEPIQGPMMYVASFSKTNEVKENIITTHLIKTTNFLEAVNISSREGIEPDNNVSVSITTNINSANTFLTTNVIVNKYTNIITSVITNIISSIITNISSSLITNTSISITTNAIINVSTSTSISVSTNLGTTYIEKYIVDPNAYKLATEFNEKDSLKTRTVEAAMYTAAKEEGRFRNELNNTTNGFAVTNILGLTDANRISVFLNTAYQGFLYTNQEWLIRTNYYWLLDTNIAKNVYSVISTNGYLFVTNYYGFVSTNYPDLKYNGPTNCILYVESSDGPYAIVAQTNEVPFRIWPLLRMTRDKKLNETKPESILSEISYGYGNVLSWTPYFIGDPPGTTRDREVFTLLTYLFTQTAVSTQNLPVQQLIQVQ